LERAQILWWDRWLQRGVADLLRLSRDGEAAYLKAPFWNFILPAGLGTGVVQLGCIGPGRDRVGRNFPLVLLLSVDASHYQEQWLESSGAFYESLGRSMLAALSHGCSAAQLDESLRKAETALQQAQRPVTPAANQGEDDILSVLNQGHEVAPLAGTESTHGWPDLPRYFNPYSVSSYWWTNPVEGAAHKSYVHGGALNAALFSRLFLGRSGVLNHSLSLDERDNHA